MQRSTVFSLCALAALPLAGTLAQGAANADISAAQIIDRNISARGGLSAWRAVKTLSWSGTMEAGGNARSTLAVPTARTRAAMPAPRPQEQAQLPFVMQMERPRKSRLELQFHGQTALQVYDGKDGWKVRPYLNRHEVESYTADELKLAAQQPDLDGPLVDYAAKGISVTLDGRDKVDGKDTYKLALTYKDKRVQHVWVDSQTFLEVKIDGAPRRLDGRTHPVSVYMRDYKNVSGLLMPTVYETDVEGVSSREKISIDKIVVNPALTAAAFAKPK